MKAKTRKSTFVPRIVVRTAVVAVVPACAAAVACGGSTSTSAGDSGADQFVVGVAAVAYPAYESGAPDVYLGVFAAFDASGPDGNRPVDAGGERDAGPTDAKPDIFTSVAIDAFGVAAVAYPAYEAGGPKDA
jgi:hypothetical protein